MPSQFIPKEVFCQFAVTPMKLKPEITKTEVKSIYPKPGISSTNKTQNHVRLSGCAFTIHSERSLLSVRWDANDDSNRRCDNDRGVMGHGFGSGPPPVHCLTRQVLVVLSRGEVTYCVELSRDRGVGFYAFVRNSTCLCTAPQFTPSAYILLTPPPPTLFLASG